MTEGKMDGLKVIAGAYKIVKPLFQVRSYLYAQVCCLRNNYEVATTALYVYENEDPSQTLKMLSEKLEVEGQQAHRNLIYPSHHVRDTFNDKNISLFFIRDFLLPLKHYDRKPLANHHALELLHGALSCLNHLHMRDIVHGNISLATTYVVRDHQDHTCKFALNILDTNYFTEEDCFEGIEQRLFESQGQGMGLKASFKDDLQSLVYVMTHLISKGRVFTLQRFQLEWITEQEFLRWKTCEYFKEMIKIIPPELEVLVEIYTIAKSLRRNEKPDYLKLIKKVISIIGNSNKIPTRKKSSIKQEQDRSETINEDEITIKIGKANYGGQRAEDRIKESRSTYLSTR